MYCILCEKPVEHFFTAEDKLKYVDSCTFFSMDSCITRDNLFDRMTHKIDWYSLFANTPLYLSLMHDKYWFKRTKGTYFENVEKCVQWGDIPGSWSPKYKEDLLLPENKRLWDDSYWARKSKEIKHITLTDDAYIEILLDGKLTNIKTTIN